jgi:hypothetical protein
MTLVPAGQEVNVTKSFQFTVVAVMALLAAAAVAQNPVRHFPTPPPSMDDSANNDTQTPISPTRHLDVARLQSEADDLARTAQTIPSDLTRVQQGMLPKDTIEKLKQIEKLSHRLRTELAP